MDHHFNSHGADVSIQKGSSTGPNHSPNKFLKYARRQTWHGTKCTISFSRSNLANARLRLRRAASLPVCG